MSRFNWSGACIRRWWMPTGNRSPRSDGGLLEQLINEVGTQGMKGLPELKKLGGTLRRRKTAFSRTLIILVVRMVYRGFEWQVGASARYRVGVQESGA